MLLLTRMIAKKVTKKHNMLLHFQDTSNEDSTSNSESTASEITKRQEQHLLF